MPKTMRNPLHKHIFELFSGPWKLERQVDTNAHMKGTAIFQSLSSTGKYYHEEGTWRPQPHQPSVEFFQDYIYALDDGCIQVYKANGIQKLDLLHTLTFATENQSLPYVATHVHPCNQDLYHGTFKIHGKNCFVTSYEVQGPEKNYKLQTIFTKGYS